MIRHIVTHYFAYEFQSLHIKILQTVQNSNVNNSRQCDVQTTTIPDSVMFSYL